MHKKASIEFIVIGGTLRNMKTAVGDKPDFTMPSNHAPRSFRAEVRKRKHYSIIATTIKQPFELRKTRSHGGESKNNAVRVIPNRVLVTRNTPRGNHACKQIREALVEAEKAIGRAQSRHIFGKLQPLGRTLIPGYITKRGRTIYVGT